ncbi:MAG TPA: protein kinase, partial [Planctomycetota bacterium]|nr:protein kinase [Planctomycetota bacterium]
LVRPDLLYFEGARERFRREVEAVARLKHPGIVQVFTVGEEEGVPYYAMEHVEGRSLDEVLRVLRGRKPERLTGGDLMSAARDGREPDPSEAARALSGSSWVDACLRLVLQVALVLDHAHRRSVLHRDLKPSNIMLSNDGRALLFDFGLASTRGTTKLTRTGSQVGSLPYMAPEQLRGEEVDERTDLYGLGVTLYELLTLQLPHLAQDPEETRRRILDGRPAAPREANPAVPWDVETVCLTAMERNRARRYASAAALADDLRALLERRPISARRPGPALRARRFVQRNPTASTAAVFGALLVAGSLAFGTREHLVSRELFSANLAKDIALGELRAANDEKDAALAEARAGFLRALEATNEMLREVGHYDLMNVPGTQALRRKLLDRSAAFYDDLLAERPADPELRLEAARGFRSQGAILRGLGELKLAEQANVRALELLEELRAERPTDRHVLAELAVAYGSLGNLLHEMGSIEEMAAVTCDAVELGRALLGLLERDGADRSEIRDAQQRLAWDKVNLAVCLAKAQRFVEAEEASAEAISFLERILEDDPTSSDVRFRLAVAHGNAGGLHNELGRYEEAEAALGASLELFDELIAEGQPLRRNRSFAARSWFNLGSVLSALGRDEEGIVAVERAEELIRGLTQEDPSEVDTSVLLIQSLARHGVLLCSAGRHAEDAPKFEEGLALAERMLRQHPSLPSVRDAHAAALVGLGWCRMRTDRLDEAEALLRTAFERFEELAQRWPDYRPAASRGDAAFALARSLRLRGRLDEAREVIDRSLPDTGRAGGTSKTRGPNLLELAEIASAQDDSPGAAAACRALLHSSLEAESLRRAAGLLAECIEAFAGDAEMAEPERNELVEACARDALSLLERAVQGGWDGTEELDTAPDLEALRERPGFEALVSRAREQ